MKIITLNTWGKYGPYEKRFPLIVSELQKIKADVICLQEVVDAELKDKIQAFCHFRDFHECYPAGLLTFSDLPIEEKIIYRYKTISTNETNDRQVVLIKTTVQNKTLWIANTHLSWRVEDEPIRLEQVKELLQCITQLTWNENTILTGDFNCTSDSAPIQKLKEAGLVDIFEKLHPKENGFTWDNDRNPFLKTHSVLFPNRRIDLMLANQHFLKNFSIKTCELAFTQPTDETFPSDHFGGCAEFD
ncbi:MAG: endonuclease/exonuclease/phosphatase family protein [Candidatus Omnitrophica bacterium]|nr:endonuclease/exonuclease/phosphatase family protein [Candidatus Omnitrophota bacterium]